MARNKSAKNRKKKTQAKKRPGTSRGKVTKKAKAKTKVIASKPKKRGSISTTSKSSASSKKAGKVATGAALKSLYAQGGTKPNLEFEKQFESELESFDETKHSVPGGSEPGFEEEEEEISPEPPRDEELLDYDDEDLEY